jgi:hypothetical protein
MSRFRRFNLRNLMVAAVTTLWSVTAQAHHSFALYDQTKLIDLSGTVQGWTWANPHCWLVLDVLKDGGKPEKWVVAGSSPNMLIRWGWNDDDIAVGDKVHVDVHPARDGRHVAQLQAVFLPNGKVLLDPAGQGGKALALGPTHVPTKPQGVPYQ